MAVLLFRSARAFNEMFGGRYDSIVEVQEDYSHFAQLIETAVSLPDNRSNPGVEAYVYNDSHLEVAGVGQPPKPHRTLLLICAPVYGKKRAALVSRTHPDWILQYPGREPIQWRNQYILNMANPSVGDYLFSALDHLLCQHHISYLKWDMNRYLAEIGSTDASVENTALCHAYIQGVYSLARRIRSAHPTTAVESVSE